jgi:outer membrane receptor protein involved in Fe transport
MGIVSDRWSWGTTHFNFGAELTRDHNANFVADWIVEGPQQWTVRPVAEARFEHQVGPVKTDTVSALVGAIWNVRDNLSLDVAVKEEWVNGNPATEFRAGLTFAFTVQKTSDEAKRR